MKQVFIAVILILFFVGCSNKQKPGTQSSSAEEYKLLGVKPDSSVPKMKLEQLLKTAGDFKGKNVVLEGVYGGACGDGDYYFKDKFDMIEFSLDQGSDIEKLKIGTPLRLYGKVIVHVRGKSEGKEENKDREATVSVEGKGVEYQ
ncbi:hypothetical protein [Stygiobacter electus]|uniref:Lipoprotein n=1 Tax=Stygiobacter electus TaxID=3032292 RepID=A0AAE3P0A5_9BACT|nr:hypothetical protein [Stygiobacter electus]MDF1611362.1 hypothetical protein [Stygiobacter electus]